MDAYHLAGLQDIDHTGFTAFPAGARYPLLTAAGVHRIAKRLRLSAANLRARSVEDIITAIDAAVALLLEPGAAYETLIAEIAAHTGYSQKMTAHVLQRMAADWRAPVLRRLLANELHDPRVLDGFVARDGRMQRATAPELSLHIFAGNVPGVAVTSMIRALLVKSAMLGKAASGEPVLAAAFARALAAVDADIGNAVAVAYWRGGTADLEAAALEHAGAVVHYGGRAAVEDLRRRLPFHVELIEHGPRISFGIVARDALASEADVDELACNAAYAVATFDQQGCVSPHVVYVEAGGGISPRDFAARLHTALTEIEVDLPVGPITAGEAVSVRDARNNAEFRAIAGSDLETFGPDSLAHTVIYDPDISFTASCLRRTVRVHPVENTSAIPALVRPYSDVLQSVAYAGGAAIPGDLAQALAHAGVTRITTFADLPWPPADWHHDGRSPLELLRWVDAEVPVAGAEIRR